MNSLARIVSLVIPACLLWGCGATYTPPGAKADLAGLAPARIEEGFAARPSNPFPAAIAAVRVQGPRYGNHSLGFRSGTAGGGRYTVVTTREVEDQASLDRVASLPQVAGVTALNRVLIPEEVTGDVELREAAARLQADLILLYTFDTAFLDLDKAATLSVVTLGLSPTRRITAVTTASAILMDTRTGYLYGAWEVTERQELGANAWSSIETAEKARVGTEQRAFTRLVEQFAGSWSSILAKAGR